MIPLDCKMALPNIDPTLGFQADHPEWFAHLQAVLMQERDRNFPVMLKFYVKTVLVGFVFCVVYKGRRART